MGPLKVAPPPAPQAVFCLTDAALRHRHRHRRNHLLLTPYGRFLGGDDAVYVVASPLTVSAAAAAAGAGSRDAPVTHAVISEWTQLEFEVRAGLRESPVMPEHEDLPEPLSPLRRPRMAMATTWRRRAPGADAAGAAPLQVVPARCMEFLLFVQSFAVVMSTVMLIKNAVSAAMFESLEL